MSRLVRDDPDSADGFAARVVKYVPSEILAFYVTVENIIKELGAAGAPFDPAAGSSAIHTVIRGKGPYVLFFFCLLIIPIYLELQKDKNQNKAFSHSIISMVLFPVWVYSIRGLIFDDQHWNLYSAALSAILLALMTLVSGVIPNSFSGPDLKNLLRFGGTKRNGDTGGSRPTPMPAPTSGPSVAPPV